MTVLVSPLYSHGYTITGILSKQKAVSILNQLYTVATINESHSLGTHKTTVDAQ